MKVTMALFPRALSPLPLLSLLLRRPSPQPDRLSYALVRATVLELAVLAGHVLVYPSGMTPERRAPAVRPGPGSRTAPAAGSPTRAGTDARPVIAPGTAAETARLTRSADTAAPSADPFGGSPADDRPPVVLLHGFIDNRSVFVLLRRFLARHGWHHLESLNYSPLTCDVRTAAELLARHVEEICDRTRHPEIDIVGHSLGGLIARYYVQCLGGDRRVRTLVTLGTPHEGTAVAPLAAALPIVRQMRTGSDLIKELRRPAPGCRTRFVSFWSDLDRVMVPVGTARVDHPDLDAVNVRVTGIGHLALPVHPAVAAAIRQALESDGGVIDTPGATSVA
ncbi:esterase/lipase family protein [Streptomyces griseus]|uniref:esterase/lipase family protein n=1 Tax=Streptomyces griseus TaxID=1911 RepID=UPI000AB2F817|nr:alpha/beta fold hydrolase [Streptomyces griseus]